jgi:hypothetical protein
MQEGLTELTMLSSFAGRDSLQHLRSFRRIAAERFECAASVCAGFGADRLL